MPRRSPPSSFFLHVRRPPAALPTRVRPPRPSRRPARRTSPRLLQPTRGTSRRQHPQRPWAPTNRTRPAPPEAARARGRQGARRGPPSPGAERAGGLPARPLPAPPAPPQGQAARRRRPAASGAGSASWSVTLAAGGQALSGAQTRQFALCADGGQLRSTRVVVASAAGPSDLGSSVAATATCPGGTVLLGGGGLTGSPASSPPNPSLNLIGSFPSGAGGSPVAASGSEANS